MPAAFSGERLPAAAAAGQPLLPACLSLLLPFFPKKLRQKTAKKKTAPEMAGEAPPGSGPEAPVKRGRGRPKGSKDKQPRKRKGSAPAPTAAPEAPVKRGRGRPKGR